MLSQSQPKVMVLAAGYGTRLRPLTEQLPKPLVPVGDKSVLAHIVSQLVQIGVERIVVNAHHRAKALLAAAQQLRDTLEVAVQVVVESDILGTAGGVANAAGALGAGATLVCNGDIVATLSYEQLWAQHQARGETGFATLAVTEAMPAGQGSIGIGADGRVCRLRDGRYGQERCSADFVGIQVLSDPARALLPPKGCLVADLLMPALAAAQDVRVAHVVKDWTDIGSPAAYLQANLSWLEERNMAAYCEPSARIGDGVQLRDTLVGRGAELSGRGALLRCVVWPGGKARAPLVDAVVLADDTVVKVERTTP